MAFVSILLLGLSLLGGCALFNPAPVIKEPVVRHAYLSEITLPEAKAYFAYAQFRLLVVDSRWDEALAALTRALAFDPHSEKLQLTLAKTYLHNQQLDEGGDALENLLREFPQNIQGLELLGELRTYQERYIEAAKLYGQILQQDAANENIRLRLIAVYDLQKDLAGALAETRTLLRLKPDSVAGRLTLARLQRGGEQTDEAIKTYRELLLKHPGQLQTILELGQLLEKEKDFGEAIDLYRESLKDNPQLLAVYQQLARILILQEHYDEALQLLQKAHQQRPQDLQILNRIGLLQLSREDYPAAEETFTQILQLHPELPRALYSLGMALMGQQRNTDALAVLQRVPQSSDIYAETVLQLGYLYRQEGDLEQGIRVLQQALDQGNQSVDIYYYLSSFLGEVERYAVAGEILRSGLKLFPQETRLHYQLGVVYERMTERSKALAEMEKVLEIDPRNADALNFIAYHYAELGENLEQALVQAQLALEQKQSSYIYDTLGWIYYRLHRYVDARDALDKAVSLDPEDPLILEHLGDTLVAQELWAEAAKIYRQSLTLDASLTTVEGKLKQLMKDHSLQ